MECEETAREIRGVRADLAALLGYIENIAKYRLADLAIAGLLAAAAAAAPAPLLRRASLALQAVVPRHRPGTVSRERAQAMLEAINAALAARGEGRPAVAPAAAWRWGIPIHPKAAGQVGVRV